MEEFNMQFYSVVTRKKVEIPASKITIKKRGKRYFAVGKYMAMNKKTKKKKSYDAWMVLSNDQAKKLMQKIKK
jgi:hypothetical protein